ncbi:MAG: hypothetical protein C0496_18625 [Erythrobacter sp.]|nr:hypothetical protein [Erythrobacter sp.]
MGADVRIIKQTFFVIAILQSVSACTAPRPSEEEIRKCVLDADIGAGRRLTGPQFYDRNTGLYVRNSVYNTITKLEFGRTITSEGGLVEISVGAPKGTTIFPTRVYYLGANANAVESEDVPQQMQGVRPPLSDGVYGDTIPEVWVFRDSFEKLKCVKAPGSQ